MVSDTIKKDDLLNLSLNNLKQRLNQIPLSQLKQLVPLLSKDKRTGAQKLAKQICWRLDWEAAEKKRLKKLSKYERQLYKEGAKVVAGVDEAGRGCLAGPLVAAAVIFPPGTVIYGLNDSKQLTPLTRQRLAKEIKAKAVCWCVAEVGVEDIDSLGISVANKMALEKAVSGLKQKPDAVLADFFKLETSCQCWPIIKGDQKSHSIAAASILAKVHRDNLMTALDLLFPGYGFKEHKGYATAAHLQVLAKRGPTKIHRQTFLRLGEICSRELPFNL